MAWEKGVSSITQIITSLIITEKRKLFRDQLFSCIPFEGKNQCNVGLPCFHTLERTLMLSITVIVSFGAYLYQDYKALISSLPERDKPSFFGLPANIERSSQRMVSSGVISQLKVVMRSGGAGEKFDRNLWSTELTPILSLWKKLNQVCVFIEILIQSF